MRSTEVVVFFSDLLNMPRSSKRKTSRPTPGSSPAKSRKVTPWPSSQWGDEIADLIPVQVSVHEPLTQGSPTILQFRNVSYTECKTGEQVQAEVKSGRMSPLVIDSSLKNDINRKLEPLFQKLKPMQNITSYQQNNRPNQICWVWKKDMEAPQLEPVCRAFCRALRSGMGDTDGKQAMRVLLDEIITRLDRTSTMEVIATGSRKASRYACLLKVEHTKEPSSTSSQENTPEYLNGHVPSKMEKSPITLRSSIQRTSPNPTGSESSTDNQAPREKCCTSDVLVFNTKSISEPMVAYLVVSIKKRAFFDPRSIAQELLGRLPYQSGIIYGMEINQLQADFYSVEKCDGDSGAVVKLFTYPGYYFQNDGFDFDFSTFKKMIVDIGCILVKQD